MRISTMVAVIFLAGPAFAAAPAGPAAGVGQSGERPGDAAMSCEQIATELQPAALAMAASIDPAKMAAITPTKKDFASGAAAAAGDMAAMAACQAGALAAMGLAGKACDSAVNNMVIARETARAANDKKKVTVVSEMGQDLEKSVATVDRARVERLMALAEEKHCS